MTAKGPVSRLSVMCLLAAWITISGCAGQTPAAQTLSTAPTVAQPTEDSNDLDLWRSYYEGQFRSSGEDTPEPPDSYPVGAREAYRLERQQWAMRQLALRNRELEEPLYGLVGAVVLALAGYGVYSLATRD